MFGVVVNKTINQLCRMPIQPATGGNSYTSVVFRNSTEFFGYFRAAAAEIAVKLPRIYYLSRLFPEQVYLSVGDEENAHLLRKKFTQQGDE